MKHAASIFIRVFNPQIQLSWSLLTKIFIRQTHQERENLHVYTEVNFWILCKSVRGFIKHTRGGGTQTFWWGGANLCIFTQPRGVACLRLFAAAANQWVMDETALAKPAFIYGLFALVHFNYIISHTIIITLSHSCGIHAAAGGILFYCMRRADYPLERLCISNHEFYTDWEQHSFHYKLICE